MEFEEILSDLPPESGTIEYKRKKANKEAVVRDLVALSNADGGKLIYGVHEEDGEVVGFDDFPDYNQYEEDISNVISAKVRPRLEIGIQKLEHDGKTLMGFSVEDSLLLHTFREKKPYVPMRFESITNYLEGDGIIQFYRTYFESEPEPTISQRREWLQEVRAEIQKIRFQAEDNDFTESRGRKRFSRTVEEASEELVELLEITPATIEENTIEITKEMLDSCRTFSDIETSASPIMDVSDMLRINKRSNRRDNEADYYGDPPEEVERKFRNAAREIVKQTNETIGHIDEVIV